MTSIPTLGIVVLLQRLACITQLVLDEKYVPKDDVAKAAFKEMQIFTYAALEEHLKTDKGKSLVSQFKQEHDAQCIYCELMKHAFTSTAAQLSRDMLLQYIAAAPGTQDTGVVLPLHSCCIGKNRSQIMRRLNLKTSS
jgi:hypothetical protein